MKIVVFGASGGTGLEIVRLALQAGHTVTAFVRTPAKLGDLQAKVQVVSGDVRNALDVEKAIQGQDAVLDALGHTKGATSDLCVGATRHIVDAMRKAGLKRYVTEAGAAVAVPGDKPQPLSGRFVRWLMGKVASALITDKTQQFDYLVNQASDIEWIVVRPPRLTNDTFSGKYTVGTDLALGMSHKISRADVADFMIKCLSDNTYVHKAPLITAV
jgi:putative NADH-flavin reductase